MGFALRQNRCRFIQNECSSALCDGSCDLDQLLLADSEILDFRDQVDLGTHLREHFSASFPHRRLVKKRSLDDFPPQKNILKDSKIVGEIEFLMNKSYAEAFHPAKGCHFDSLATKEDFSGSWFDHAGQDFDKSGFTGTVLPHDRMDLARLKT